ncbi:MAG: CocE/NonD family hydrolase, partial [Jatrophihabitantaceae bacterium]
LQARAFPDGLPAAQLRIPALHAGGWWDPINTWALRDWAIAGSNAPAAADQQLLMAATNHIGVCFDCGDEPGMPPDPAQALEPSLRFFERHLRGGGEDGTAPVRFEIAGAGWRTAERWPPPGTRPWTLHLVAAARAAGSLVGGALAGRPDHTSSVARWIHDPSAPVPSLGMDPIRAIAHEAAIHLRPDVATFTSEPVSRSIDLVGPAVAMLEFESDAPCTHLVATLVTLAPDGVAHQLLEGITAVDTLHGPVLAVVELGAIAFRLRRGHRLRLAIASSRFPTYLPHPGTSEDVWTAVRTRATSQRLVAGGPLGSRLQLSTLRARR